MRAITVLRIVAAMATMVLVGACNDSFSPPPNDPSLGGMTIVPRTATIRAGEVVAFQARLIDEHGDRLSGVTIRWHSSDDAVATVAATGEVVGRAAGHAVITASALGKAQISTVRVLSRPGKGDTKGLKPGTEPPAR